jgi:hypothetical protein
MTKFITKLLVLAVLSFGLTVNSPAQASLFTSLPSFDKYLWDDLLNPVSNKIDGTLVTYKDGSVWFVPTDRSKPKFRVK